MKLCGAKTRGGGTCKHESGWGTDHVGEGRCKLHGGSSIPAAIKTGKYAKKTSRQLKDKMERHLKDPNPLDLSGELALLRSLIDHFMEKLDEAEAKKIQLESEYTPAELKGQDIPDPVIGFIEVINPLIDNLRKVADTISKIQSRELLTAAEMTLVLVVLATVLREEVTDGKTLERITRKLRTRITLPQLVGGEVISGE